MNEPSTLFIILRVKQLAARLSISKSSIYERINPHSPRYDSTFPKKITLSPGVVGFLQQDADAWIQSRINASCSKSAGGSNQKTKTNDETLESSGLRTRVLNQGGES